jgi:hypothetical protein
MFRIFTKAALAALIGLGAMSAIPATASANDFGVRIEVAGPRHHYDDRRHSNDRYYRGPMCSNRLALQKAARTGLRGARIVARSPRAVVIEGRRHHRHDRMVFANNRGCPIVRY